MCYSEVSGDVFFGDHTPAFWRVPVKFMIKYTSRVTSKGKEVGWAIVRYLDDDNGDEFEDKICWWALHSSNMSLPPFEGWVPQDDRLYANPKLSNIS